METILLILSVVLISLVLLQSNKASDAGQIINGGNQDLFQAQKERGFECYMETSAKTGVIIMFIQ